MRAAVLVLVAILSACDAYDHDLGPAPFLCGPSEPRCPTGYSCIEDPNSGDQVCVDAESLSGTGACADDSAIEPNDTLAMATAAAGSYERDGLAICPPTDKDTFVIEMTGAGRIELAVTFERGATLRAAILNEGGVPIATGTLDEGTRTLDAFADVASAGTYYAQVSSPSGRANNYSITLGR
jgi:hypothetical protein